MISISASWTLRHHLTKIAHAEPRAAVVKRLAACRLLIVEQLKGLNKMVPGAQITVCRNYSYHLIKLLSSCEISPTHMEAVIAICADHFRCFDPIQVQWMIGHRFAVHGGEALFFAFFKIETVDHFAARD
jgi:hypothetical protein